MKRSLLHHKVIQNRNSSRGYLRNILLLLLIFLFGISTIFPPILYAVESPDANKITEYHLDSPPHPPQPITPSVVSEEEILKSSTAVLLTDVPTSNWTYGCAATAAGMLFGYYDRIGYDNLYTGPANGGICPLTNLGQGTPGQDNGYPNTGSCHIIATEKGHDGITTPAHVDAYWSSYLDPGPDPWKTTPIDVLIQQGFETSFPPVGWTTTGWLDTFYGPSHTGSHHAYSWTAGDSFTLPLCTLNLSSTLTFWYAAEHMNHPMTLEVYLDEILLWKDEAYTHTTYQQAVINLSEYTGLHQLSILGNTSDTYGQLLDDIQLTTSKEPLSGACVADYIGTNQWKWDTGSKSFNVDGSTCYFLWTPPLSLPLYDYIPRSSYGLPPVALSHGLRLFAESRGYQLQWNDTVINHYGSLGAYEVYNQPVDTFVPGGFSFMDYTKEIDQGYPVLIHVEGHTMIGVGYDHVGSSDILYVHDTWDNHIHSMIWGGYYGVGTAGGYRFSSCSSRGTIYSPSILVSSDKDSFRSREHDGC